MLEKQKSVFYTSPDKTEILSVRGFSQNDIIFKEIFEYNVYNIIPEMNIETGIVLDVGAHIGIFSKYASLNGAEKVIAFEMDSYNFECLRKNVKFNDDVFNCILSEKNLSIFRLENGELVNSFSLNYLFEGGLFKKANFLKIDVMGKELVFLKSINKKVYNVINKISVKMYNLTDDDKEDIVNFMKFCGYEKIYNVIIPNHEIQFFYFWK